MSRTALCACFLAVVLCSVTATAIEVPTATTTAPPALTSHGSDDPFLFIATVTAGKMPAFVDGLAHLLNASATDISTFVMSNLTVVEVVSVSFDTAAVFYSRETVRLYRAGALAPLGVTMLQWLPVGTAAPAQSQRFTASFNSSVDQQQFPAALAAQLHAPVSDIDVLSEDTAALTTVFVFNSTNATRDLELSNETKVLFQTHKLPQVVALTWDDMFTPTPFAPEAPSPPRYGWVFLAAVGGGAGLCLLAIIVVVIRRCCKKKARAEELSGYDRLSGAQLQQPSKC